MAVGRFTLFSFLPWILNASSMKTEIFWTVAAAASSLWNAFITTSSGCTGSGSSVDTVSVNSDKKSSTSFNLLQLTGLRHETFQHFVRSQSLTKVQSPLSFLHPAAQSVFRFLATGSGISGFTSQRWLMMISTKNSDKKNTYYVKMLINHWPK